MKRRRFLLSSCHVVAACAGVAAFPGAARAQVAAFTPQLGLLGRRESPYFTAAAGEAVQCGLCPRACLLAPGERGYCRVRENIDGRLYSRAYGNPCAAHVDPIEKKPLFHVLPGTRSFSIATAGCNLDCKFCQNWEISQARPDDTLNFDMPPAMVAELAEQNGCRSVASTYVEPTIFLEYMLDVGKRANERGILNVAHSNGFVNERPLDDLCANLDAVCVDLKGFTEAYYRDMTEGALAPVLDTLRRLRAKGKHLELVNLVIPGANDRMDEIRDMCRFVRDELGAATPLHFTRFYPMYKLKGLPPTPVETLERARETALAEGLLFIYVGNVPGNPAENTYCPQCKAELIHRMGYRTTLLEFRDGKCLKCGYQVPGVWS